MLSLCELSYRDSTIILQSSHLGKRALLNDGLLSVFFE